MLPWEADLARSTVYAFLRRHSLSGLDRLEPRPPVVRYERKRPGELVHLDTKMLGRIGPGRARIHGRQAGNRHRAMGWDRVHIATDDHTRRAFAHQVTFGPVGAMSTAVTPGQNEIVLRLACLPVPPVRVYLDTGGHEASDAPRPGLQRRWSSAMIRETRQIRDAPVVSGLRDGDTLRLVEDPDAIHREVHWAGRLPDALRLLVGPPSVLTTETSLARERPGHYART